MWRKSKNVAPKSILSNYFCPKHAPITVSKNFNLYIFCYIKVWSNAKKIVPPPWEKWSFFCAAILHPLWAKMFKFETISFQYFSPRIPKIQKVWTLIFGKWGQKDVKTEWTNFKKSVKNFFCHGDFTPFMSKNLQIWDHFFPTLFPKDSENPKSLDIGLQEVGAKIPLNCVSFHSNLGYSKE